MFVISSDLAGQLMDFRSAREWNQFHTPRNLAVALAVEASELLEIFQWTKDDEIDVVVARDRARIEDEIADVAILLNYLCVDLGVDLNKAVATKMGKNEEKYPVELARGNATKYDRL